MANYINLDGDFTDIKNQAYSFVSSLGDIEDEAYHTMAHKVLRQHLYDINTDFSLLKSKLDSLGLEIGGLAHVTINSDALLIHASAGQIFIPLADYGSCVYKIYSINPGADPQFDEFNYLDEDVTLLETISVTDQPFIIKASLAYTIETTDSSKLTDFLVVYTPNGTTHLFT